MNRYYSILAGFVFFGLVMVSPVDAGDWTTTTVDTIGSLGSYTSLALDSDGKARISYFDATNKILKYAAWNGTLWDIQIVDSNLGTWGGYPSLRLDSSGNPRISYYDNTNGHLKYAAWNGASWDLQTVDSSSGVGSYTSLALDNSGNPHISYCVTTNSDLKYAKWNGVSWNIETVDAGSVGKQSSLSLDESGNPKISYFVTAPAHLKYVSWDGVSWNSQIVDVYGSGGLYTSLALDSNGYPRISYYDTNYNCLKYGTWNGVFWDIMTVDYVQVLESDALALDSNGYPRISYYDNTHSCLKCAAWKGTSWDIQVVDTGTVGKYSSLALDRSGNPRISYYDETNTALKFAMKKELITNFTATPTSGTATIPVSFTDTTTGATPVTWSWSFGDGGLSSVQNPTHTYLTPGNFTVYLTAGDAFGQNTTARVGYITVTGPDTAVVADFTGNPLTGPAPLAVTFTDTSTGFPDHRVWNFGSWEVSDGGISTEQNPSHTYSSAGNYTVSLTVNNSAGSDTLSRVKYIVVTPTGPTPVTADFTADPPLTGDAPLTVSFHDASTGLPNRWSWSFGDGGISMVQNPSHSYTTAGAYTVTLTAANSSESGTKSMPGYVTVTSVTTPVVANFAGTPGNGVVPLTVSFMDTSAGQPNVWSWSFGDGAVSSVQSPTHTYTSTGTYTVSLAAVNGTNTNTLTQEGYITVSPVPVTTPPTEVPAGSGDSGSSDAGPAPVKPGDLTFFVDSSYLARHGIMPADVEMMSYTGGKWVVLPTRFTGASGNRFYFTADSDQYSLLSVGNKKDGMAGLPVLAVTTSPTPFMYTTTVTRASLASSEPRRVIRQESEIPVDREITNVSLAMPAPSDSTVAPCTILAVFALGSIGLILGSIRIRRWWIRRQNPALFETYD